MTGRWEVAALDQAKTMRVITVPFTGHCGKNRPNHRTPACHIIERRRAFKKRIFWLGTRATIRSALTEFKRKAHRP